MKFIPSAVAFILASLWLSAAATGRSITVAEVKEKAALGLHLLRLGEGAEPVWKTDEEIDQLIAQETHFFDLTDVFSPEREALIASVAKERAAAVVYPKPSHQTAVKLIVASISLTQMQSYLTTLTSFNNRYYKAQTGLDASVWIRDTIADIIKANPASGASVALFSHTWTQASIVAKIPGTTSGPLTILGAHMDSVNARSTTTGRAPGADDDGSGSVNLMEAFRALLSAGFKPTTPVEFHWYSGEEGGLKGSQAVATSYKNAGAQVKGMLQIDMSAYVKPGTTPVIAFMPDYTDKNLTAFIGSVIDTYTTAKWVINDPCGYACSDHASWNQLGYPSAMPFEGMFDDQNPNIHSASDTVNVSGFNLTHSLQYAKFAAAYAYELATV